MSADWSLCKTLNRKNPSDNILFFLWSQVIKGIEMFPVRALPVETGTTFQPSSPTLGARIDDTTPVPADLLTSLSIFGLAQVKTRDQTVCV